MFNSFFPRPSIYFLSALVWIAVLITIWFAGLSGWHTGLEMFSGLAQPVAEGARPPFLTEARVWTYGYILLGGFLFALFWMIASNHHWRRWSVIGSTIIILATYFNVQISLYLNDWYGEFFDLIQNALANPNTVTLDEYLGKIWTVAGILVVNIAALVLLDFFVSHYVFRWRWAMNDYYMRHWGEVRDVEGAAQRVQEDTMRFARIVEGLGVRLVRSIMTLIAFLPLLYQLSTHIPELPFIGPVEHSLVYVALLSAIFGTVLLAVVGIRLPGLEFNNQRVEAAYRKELVYGEDHAERAQPLTVLELFDAVRRNYFRLYFNYLYFGVARWTYLQASNFIPLIAMGPAIVTGTITFGIYRQIANAFDEVEDSLRFLANSWLTIIDLISIYKRLIAFEARIEGDERPDTPLSAGSFSMQEA
ncbi:MAG: peptide antibiotic transporter SbmA [Nitratireductor sp.]|nr:peptide antibiotic transporter SbmA [Nitratireductor sp.]